VLREAFYGVRRFDALAAHIGVTDAVLSTHLRALTANGLLERTPYREPGERTRYEYRLTATGADFLPVLLALRQWTERSLWKSVSSVEVIEKETAAPIEVRVCAGVGPSLPAERIVIRPRQ
jgi:DNA-binding HxlR family transcriptional regulator